MEKNNISNRMKNKKMKNRKYSFKNNLTSNFKYLSFKSIKQGKLNNKKIIQIKLMKL
jgi:hypothetical protein